MTVPGCQRPGDDQCRRAVEGGSAQTYYVGYSFVRDFKNSDPVNDSLALLSDVNALWVPGMNTDLSQSSWSAFIGRILADFGFVAPTLELAASVLVIGILADRVARRDGKADHFLTLSGSISESEWSCVSNLLAKQGNMGIGLDALPPSASQSTDGSSGDEPLSRLEEKGLAKMVLVEVGAELLSMWKLAI